MEVVTINLDVSTDWKFTWSNEFHTLIDILILSPFKEWTLDNSWILLSWFENGNGVISQIERNDKSSINVLWDLCVESSSISENLFVIINIFKEIYLWFFSNKFIDITEGINFVTEAIMWWYLNDNWVSWLWLFNVTYWEISTVCLLVVFLGENINTINIKDSSVGNEWFSELDFVTC